jgi:simple sugar transport system permease protein
MEGSGQQLLLRACAGLIRPVHGRLRLAGQDVLGQSYRGFRQRGVAFMPASRLEEGLIPGLDLTEHFALTEPNAGLLIQRQAAQARTATQIEAFRIRGTPASPVEALSGGNQQRALLALVGEDLSLLLLEHPTRGLDIESVVWIWEKLKDRCRRGTAIVFVSSDLDEILHYSDRIHVFFGGRVSPSLEARTTTVEQLGQLIGGKGWPALPRRQPDDVSDVEGPGAPVKGAARLSGPALRVGAILLALLFTTAILLIAGAPPLEAYRQIALGSVGSIKKVTDVMVAWVPLVLATSGLLLTFAAGLWNIGIEGQITLGAIFATGVLRVSLDGSLPPVLAITAALAAGIVGGAIWALLAGLLKAYGGVNEIFGGLGLNFVAVALNVWLIFGPWGRPGVASMSGTEPFPDSLALPALGGLRLSPWAVVLALAGFALVYFLLQGTYFGLRLKAVGKNPRAAFLLGIPTVRYMLLAFALCGGLAGAAGAVQVTAVYHRLIPPRFRAGMATWV